MGATFETYLDPDENNVLKGNGLEGIPLLRQHFAYHANSSPDYIVTDQALLARMGDGMPQDIMDSLKQALQKRLDYEIDLARLEKNERFLKEKELELEERERNIKRHREMMINAINEELRVAFYFGPQITEFDSQNPDGVRQKFRTDIETMDFMVEVTIGQKKSLEQLNDYVAAKTMRQELIMYAPNMDEKWANKHVSERGFHLVRNPVELALKIKELRIQP